MIEVTLSCLPSTLDKNSSHQFPFPFREKELSYHKPTLCKRLKKINYYKCLKKTNFYWEDWLDYHTHRHKGISWMFARYLSSFQDWLLYRQVNSFYITKIPLLYFAPRDIVWKVEKVQVVGILPHFKLELITSFLDPR